MIQKSCSREHDLTREIAAEAFELGMNLTVVMNSIMTFEVLLEILSMVSICLISELHGVFERNQRKVLKRVNRTSANEEPCLQVFTTIKNAGENN